MIIVWLKGWFKCLVRLYLPVYKCETDALTVLFAGYSAVKKKYFIRSMLEADYRETFMGRRWFWKIPDLTRSSESDIVISEISQLILNRMYAYGGYILPEFVNMRINIDSPLQEIIDRSDRFPEIIRKVRKYNMTYEILTDEDSLSHFIDRFYLPYITKKHGENARIADVDTILKSTPSPSILAIREDGVIVAESLIQRSGDCLAGLQVGIIDGNEEYLRHGVLGAIYYFFIIEGQRLGCTYYDIGSTPPFLTDGLTKYKMGLGAEFVQDNSPLNEYLWLGVNESSDAAKEFIRTHPFISISKDHRLVKCST
jgi:hypothetical protein